MHLHAYNQKLLTEGCTLAELVGAIIPPSTRDPLLAKLELPRFGLNSGVPRVRSDSESTATAPSLRTSHASQEEERFDAYEKAARRNYILSRDAARFQLNKSPLKEAVISTSAYPEAELTPELRHRKGAIQAFKSLRKLGLQTPSHSPTPIPPRSHSSARKRAPDQMELQLARIHKTLDTAYSSSIPRQVNFVSSHSTFLRKSTTPSSSRPSYTAKSRLRRAKHESSDHTLSGEDILTILTSYKEEQAANKHREERTEAKTAASDTSRRTGRSAARSPLPACRTLELVGIEDKSASHVRFPRREVDRSRQARFKLPQQDLGDLRIEMESGFMQIVQANFSPRFEPRKD